LPLRGLRVLDLSDGAAGKATRLLADMGADVILVEPPEGAASRHAEPRLGATSFEFVTTHWNKRGIILDLTDSMTDPISSAWSRRQTSWSSLIRRDISTASGLVRTRCAAGNQPWSSSRSPASVNLGPYRDWRATEKVLIAMSSALMRSGAPGPGSAAILRQRGGHRGNPSWLYLLQTRS
jgi:hypothetical protein